MTSTQPADWNEARSIAARLRTLVTTDADSESTAEYGQLRDEYPTVEFPAWDTLATDVAKLDGTPTEQINALAREILDWQTAEEVDDSPAVQTDWNAARSLATDLIDAVTEPNDDEDSTTYATVANVTDITLPPEETVADRVAEATGSRTERINEIARWIQTWDEDEWDPSLSLNTDATETEEETAAETETTRLAAKDWETDIEALAAALLDNFDNNEGRYGEIIRNYSDFALPSLGEAMMAARRATGDDADRVAQMVDYIQTWDEDRTQADTNAYRPMGKR